MSDTRNSWDAFAHVMLIMKGRGHGESVEIYRSRMSNNIQQLEKMIQRARRLYNADANLLSLPDELLTEILLYVRDAVPERASRDGFSVSESVWFNSVMVCRRLRQAILNSVSLHTRLSTCTRSLENVRCGFVLSKALPICLHVRSPSKYQALYDDVQLHGHRIRSLSLILGRGCSTVVSAWIHLTPSPATFELRTNYPEVISNNEDINIPLHYRATLEYIKLDAAT